MELEQLTILVKQFNDARDERLEMDRKSRRLHETEVELKTLLIAALKDSGLTKVSNIKFVIKMKPVAKDWDLIHQYIIDNDAWDLIQKRFGEVACRERWDDGIEIPGIGKFPADDLSIGKRVDGE